MKKISLSSLALLLACATVFADGKNDKTDKTTTKKAKTECSCPSDKCMKDGKTVDCPKGCTDKDCKPVCSDKKCC